VERKFLRLSPTKESLVWEAFAEQSCLFVIVKE
jgi:hypothetical protein